MAVTLIVETGAGLANANSYASLGDADAYHQAHLHADDWLAATVETKSAALVWASRLLDEAVDWHGVKAVTLSGLRWPRAGVADRDGVPLQSNAIPPALRHATAEFARHLIANDRTTEPAEKGVRSIAAGGIAIALDPGDRPGLLPASVRRLIAPLGWPLVSHRVPLTRA
jgi:hypothetical protein